MSGANDLSSYFRFGDFMVGTTGGMSDTARLKYEVEQYRQRVRELEQGGIAYATIIDVLPEENAVVVSLGAGQVVEFPTPRLAKPVVGMGVRVAVNQGSAKNKAQAALKAAAA